jgi:hypothetical protein
MNKTLKLLAVLVFAGAALNACPGCPEKTPVEPKNVDETEEITKTVVDTEVVEEEKSE